MSTFQLKARGAFPGIAEGPAIVCPDSIAGNSGALGDMDGVIYEKGNVNYGRCIKNAILVVPCSKGSNGFSARSKAGDDCGSQARRMGGHPYGCPAGRGGGQHGPAHGGRLRCRRGSDQTN